MRSKAIAFGIMAAMLAGMPAAATDHAAGDAQQQPQADPPGGPFVLRDHFGRVVYDQDLRGKFLLIYFGYTFCPDVCPTTLQTMAQVLDQLGDKADEVWPLFITVDPQRDTAKVLNQYVTAFHPKILGLTGPEPYIEATVKKYRIKVERVDTAGVPGGYTLDHTSSLLLMGPYGEYLGRYPHGLPPEDIAADLKARFRDKK